MPAGSASASTSSTSRSSTTCASVRRSRIAAPSSPITCTTTSSIRRASAVGATWCPTRPVTRRRCVPSRSPPSRFRTERSGAVPDPRAHVPLGRTALRVTRLGLGCAPLGNLYAAIGDAEARATVDAAWNAGLRWFDTAPLYGHGLSEQRLGAALRNRPRAELVVATKVGWTLVPGEDPQTIFVAAPALRPVHDYSADAVRRGIDASLARTGLGRIDVLHVHDPDDHEA